MDRAFGPLDAVRALAEHRRIEAKVSELMALFCAFETQLAATGATAANPLSALVAELTNGVAAAVPSANGAPHPSPATVFRSQGRSLDF